jgi:hypothetical protein
VIRSLLVIAALVVPAHATSVSPSVFATLRISGETQIVPDEPTRKAIAKADKRIIGSFKLCVDTKGIVSSVALLKSTGYRDYDAKLQFTMRSWRYRPTLAGGKPVAICGIVTFLYSQPKPPPVKITA